MFEEIKGMAERHARGITVAAVGLFSSLAIPACNRDGKPDASNATGEANPAPIDANTDSSSNASNTSSATQGSSEPSESTTPSASHAASLRPSSEPVASPDSTSTSSTASPTPSAEPDPQAAERLALQTERNEIQKLKDVLHFIPDPIGRAAVERNIDDRTHAADQKELGIIEQDLARLKEELSLIEANPSDPNFLEKQVANLRAQLELEKRQSDLMDAAAKSTDQVRPAQEAVRPQEPAAKAPIAKPQPDPDPAAAANAARKAEYDSLSPDEKAMFASIIRLNANGSLIEGKAFSVGYLRALTNRDIVMEIGREYNPKMPLPNGGGGLFGGNAGDRFCKKFREFLDAHPNLFSQTPTGTWKPK